MTKTSGKLTSAIGSTIVPRFDIEQIDIAPLMAGLLGIPVPVNSYGQLPHQYLNTSKVSPAFVNLFSKVVSADQTLFIVYPLVLHRQCYVP